MVDPDYKKRLQKEYDDAERMRQSAARRLEWMEKRLYNAETLVEFDRLNMEFESAEADAKRYGQFAAYARISLASIEIDERNESR